MIKRNYTRRRFLRVLAAVMASLAVPSWIGRAAGRVIDGKDIWPLMSGKPGATSPHEAYFYYRGTDLEAVRSGKWKLRRVKKTTELYDLEADIGEKNNLANTHPQIVQRLTRTMEEFDRQLKTNARPPGKVVNEA